MGTGRPVGVKGQPLYFEAGTVRREILHGRRGRRCAPFQEVDALQTRLMRKRAGNGVLVATVI